MKCYKCDGFIEDQDLDEGGYDYCLRCVAHRVQKALDRARDYWKEYVDFRNHLDARNLAFKAIDNELAKIGAADDRH